MAPKYTIGELVSERTKARTPKCGIIVEICKAEAEQHEAPADISARHPWVYYVLFDGEVSGPWLSSELRHIST